jgi:hypothetical protein
MNTHTTFLLFNFRVLYIKQVLNVSNFPVQFIGQETYSNYQEAQDQEFGNPQITPDPENIQ